MIGKYKRDIWGGKYPISGISFSEEALFAEIWSESLGGENPYAPAEYAEKFIRLKSGPLALRGDTRDRLRYLGSKMHLYYRAGSSLTQALFNDRYNCASATAVSLIFLEMIDFEEFSRARIGILHGQNGNPDHVLLKLESSGEGNFADKYENFDFGFSAPDSNYKSIFGENPQVRPKKYAISSCLDGKARALSEMGLDEEAIQCQDMAIRLGPEETGFLNNKAIILSCKGKYDEAIKCYDKALMINPDDKDILEKRNELLKKVQ